MANDPDGRPCNQCGAVVPEGRSVCPACSSLQLRQATPAPTDAGTAPPFRGTPIPPPDPQVGAPAPSPNGAPWTGAASASPTANRSSSKGPLIGVVVVVVALVAAGAWFFTRDGDDSSDTSDPSAASTADPSAGVTTPPGKPVSTTAPPTIWTDVSDPVSGLRWKMPGATVVDIRTLETGVAGPLGVTGRGWGVGVGQPGAGPTVKVAIWSPDPPADQATVESALRSHRDFQGPTDRSYPEPVTVAGAPATAFDASTDSSSVWQAFAVVDGSFVVVRVNVDDGTKADPEVFAEVLASFTKG